MNPIRMHWIILLSLLFVGCVSGPKHMAEMDKALTEIQAGRIEEGRGQLKRLCDDKVGGACALLGKPTELKRQLPIMQSVSSAEQSRFVVLAPKGKTLTYFMMGGAAPVRLKGERFDRSFSEAAVDQVESFNLEVNTEYELLVLGPEGELWDKRRFRALDLNRKRPRLAVVSCQSDAMMKEQAMMWPQLLEQKPDVVLMIGDNVYADFNEGDWSLATPEQLWKRYAETRERLTFFRADPLIPVFATWDDHDYGRNDADRTYPHKKEATDVFLTFFAQRKPAPGFERGPGVASWWSAFNVQFALLDDRSFRSPNKLDIPDQTHFGADQEKWIQKNLKLAKTPVFLVSGDQFFGAYHPFESYEGSHPKSFGEQLKAWRKAKVPILFMSGDRHLSEIIKTPKSALGYSTYEITSSGIHAKVFPDGFERHPSPNQVVGVAGEYNFSIVELMSTSRSRVHLDVKAFGPEKKVLYQKTLTVRRK